MSLKGSNVLVTGAAGFTGSHLCRALVNQGANVHAYVKRGNPLFHIADILDNVTLIKGDILDLTSLSNNMKDIDYVFHLAAITPIEESRNVPWLSVQVNTIGTFNVAWTAQRAGVKKMVYTSTCHVYGNQPESSYPLKETAIPNPPDIYSASKYSAEILLKQFVNMDGMDIMITRSFNKFGPNQVGDWLFPRTIKKVLTQNKIKVGNPDSTRDYVYITDVINGYILLMEKGKTGDIFNFGSEKERTVKEIVDEIIKASGKKVSVEWEVFRKHDVNRSLGDCSKAKKVLGWKREVPFEEGVKRTVEWWKNHPEFLK